MINLVEFEFFIRGPARRDYFVQSLQNPAIDQRCSRGRRPRPAGVSAPGYRTEVMQIAKQNTKRVANAAIGIAETRKDFFRERHVGRVINAAGPKSKKIGAILANEMIGSSWFLICAGFGNLLPIHIDDETVSHTRFVWRTVIQGDACHQGGLKPAAMLVGCLEI